MAQRLQQALRLHQSGRLAEAEALYREILEADPGQGDALHLAGLIALQRGALEQANALISRAIATNPSKPMYHSNLGLVLKAQGRLEAAGESFRQALALRDDIAELHFNLGALLRDQGQLDEAVAAYRRALEIRADYIEALLHLGQAQMVQGVPEQALASYSRVRGLRPDSIEAILGMAGALYQLSKLEQAAACLREALALNPNLAEVHNNLGILLGKMGRREDALASFTKALELRPASAEAHNNLGNVLQDLGRPKAAADSFRAALALKPEYADARGNLGNVLLQQGQLGEAVDQLRQALILRPDYAEAHNNLGNALLQQARFEEAIHHYRAALKLRPDYSDAHSNLLLALTHDPECTPEAYLAEARRYGDRVSAGIQPYTQWNLSPAGEGAGPLRVGLVSGDLVAHPVGFFLEHILPHLDPEKIELTAYVTNPRSDDLTARIRPAFAAWHSIVPLNDRDAARRIHADGMHILIDLAGHTGYNRLPVFARKPAPVQISWPGYWASTGVPGIDYLFVDRVLASESIQAQFTESLWYLPDTRLCFAAPRDAPPVSPPPVADHGYVTFGSFQKAGKINDRVLALWSRVLAALPDARLRVQNRQMGDAAEVERLRARLAGYGIDPQRLVVAGGMPRTQYLAAYAEVDIVLDTFPFPGGTTTCDALWMGVPTLTLAGNTLVGRQGVSMLACVGLNDWVARDEDDFLERAVSFACNAEGLAHLRAGLRERAAASPLFDGPRFAVSLEHALHTIWRQAGI